MPAQHRITNPSIFLGGDTSRSSNIVLRTNLMKAFLPRSRQKLLEVGCGKGGYFSVYRELFASVTGVEPNDEKLSDVNPLEDIVSAVAEHLPFQSNTFDAVVLNEVLEHVQDDDKALAEVFRVLKPTGRFFLFGPNRFFPFESHGIETSGGKRISPWTPFMSYIPSRILRLFGLKGWARNYFYFAVKRKLRTLGFTIVHLDFVPQTFENISAYRPSVLKEARATTLRKILARLSRIHFIRLFVCVSFYIVAEKPIHEVRGSK